MSLQIFIDMSRQMAQSMVSFINLNKQSIFKILFNTFKIFLKGFRIPLQHERHFTNSEDPTKEDYCRPRPLNEAYSVPPLARPITTIHNSNQSIFSEYSSPRPIPSPKLVLKDDTSLADSRNIGFTQSNKSFKYFNFSDKNFLQGYMQMKSKGLEGFKF